MTAAPLSLVEPDMEISPIRLSPGSSLPESIHNAIKSQVFQVSIQADALAGAPAPLTATLQVSPQPIPHEVIELTKRLPRITQPKVVGPAPQVTIHPPNQFRQRRMTLLRVDQILATLPVPASIALRDGSRFQ